jgi:hypothetical protein
MQLKFRTIRAGLEDWHFVENCPQWPAADFVEKLDAPPIAQLCEKCIELSASRFVENAPRAGSRAASRF